MGAAKKMPLTELEDYKSDLLSITEEDEMLGYKHVFQTRLTKTTVGEEAEGRDRRGALPVFFSAPVFL